MFEIFLDGANDGNSKRVLVSVSYNAVLKSWTSDVFNGWFWILTTFKISISELYIKILILATLYMSIVLVY